MASFPPEKDEYFRNKARRELAQDREESKRIKALSLRDFLQACYHIAQLVGDFISDVIDDIKRIFGPLLDEISDDDDFQDDDNFQDDES